jgi:hypothetical protein
MPPFCHGAASYQQPVAEVDDLLRVELEIPHFEKSMPHAEIPLVAAMHADQVGQRVPTGKALRHLELERGVQGEKQDVEVPPIRSFDARTPDVRGQGPAEPRAWWQPRPGTSHRASKHRKPDEDPLIQSPRALARNIDWRPHSPHDLDVLLRHRLLRQPGGFEGVLPGRERAKVHDEPVPDRVEPGRLRVDLDAALASLSVKGARVRTRSPRSSNRSMLTVISSHAAWNPRQKSTKPSRPR